jgi:stage IV sporulation protein A
MPEWIAILNNKNTIKNSYIESIKNSVVEVDKLRDIDNITKGFLENENIEKAYLSNVDPSTGEVIVSLEAPCDLYSKALTDIIKIDVSNKAELLSLFQDFNEAKNEYDQIKYALKMVKQTGYGVATPTLSDMKLEKPEVVKQGSRFGVKLKAVAPSIHMIRVDVQSSFEPMIGSEVQSKQLIDYIMKDYDRDPESIWNSEIFGRKLCDVINDGVRSKINAIPEVVQYKYKDALNKVVNKTKGGVIAIVL